MSFLLVVIPQLLRGSVAQVDEAVRTLHKRQGPVTDGAVPTYKRLVRSVLSRAKEDEKEDHSGVVSLLRESLFRLANQFKSQSTDKQLLGDMEELLMAVHYQHILYSAQAFGLRDIAVKSAITLLKYPFVIPQDKAFYQAGTVCKELGRDTNLAFMLLNR